MTLAEAKKTVSVVAYLEEAGIALPGHAAGTTAEGNTFYRLDPCPVCGHRDHFDVFPDTNTYCSRSGCTEGSSIIDLIMDLEGISQGEAINNVKERAGIPVNGRSTAAEDFSPTEKPPAGSVSGGTPAAAAVESADYTDLIASWYHKTTPEEKQYFIDRGIPGTLVDNYKLCFGDVYNKHTGRKERRAIFTAWDNDKCIYYAARTINGAEPKYLNPTGPKPIVNLHMLQGEGGLVAVIVEGIADALAVEAATGVPGVATLGEPSRAVQDKIRAAKGILILTAFDNDDRGDKAREQLQQFGAIHIPPDYKDVADYAKADAEGLRQAIEKARTGGSVADYITGGFLDEMTKNRNTVPVSTGFDKLDDLLSGGFYEGLFVIGGLPATGKTAFMLQLANTIAQQGTPVLYATLEVSAYELTARSVSARMAEDGERRAYISIMRGNVDNNVMQPYLKDYVHRRGKNLYIKQAFFGMNATEIGAEAEQIRLKTGKPPIIVVDYLQALKPEAKFTTDKEKIDQNITTLKGISDRLGTTVIVLSSFNRQNGERVSMKSFKESGSIEYTADFLAGLETVEKEELEPVVGDGVSHRVNLKVLKNRRGPDGLNLALEFHKPYSLFEEVHKAYIKRATASKAAR